MRRRPARATPRYTVVTYTKLFRSHDDETQAEYGKAFDQGRTENRNLLIKAGACLSDHESPGDVGPWQAHGPLHEAQRFAGKLLDVVDVRPQVLMLVIGLHTTVPQGAGADLVKALAADLKIKAAIGFQKALVSKWPDKSHFATGGDRGDRKRRMAGK